MHVLVHMHWLGLALEFGVRSTRISWGGHPTSREEGGLLSAGFKIPYSSHGKADMAS